VTTTVVRGSDVTDTRAEPVPRVARHHVGRTGIGTVGVLTILIAAWGGLIPFIGPLFGFRGNGEPSWHWSNAHLVLAVVPGVVGVCMGLVVLRGTTQVAAGRGRMSLALAGLITVLCGAWFVIGPVAWPVLTTNGGYFASAAPVRSLAYVVGYALGTGVILAVCGGYVMGWASRHQMSAAPLAAADAAPAPVVVPQVSDQSNGPETTTVSPAPESPAQGGLTQ
jgi:hypothetical protein